MSSLLATALADGALLEDALGTTVGGGVTDDASEADRESLDALAAGSISPDADALEDAAPDRDESRHAK